MPIGSRTVFHCFLYFCLKSLQKKFTLVRRDDGFEMTPSQLRSGMSLLVVGHRLLHSRGTNCFFLLFERIGRVGVGHVNVSCKLRTCWMLRNARIWVGGAF